MRSVNTGKFSFEGLCGYLLNSSIIVDLIGIERETIPVGLDRRKNSFHEFDEENAYIQIQYCKKPFLK